ncbi:PhzF family phenazine biosynthesis protein [Marivirga harenae]|uniref:PhzF family phenazine biosynthesis protein n=1 Tax=Marivirga harenae TaxID=2010992 RepID=UPI0026DFEB21|nr:PhzF family phenazine biosynthesis protein [Marivirga harenae]WKV11143.1 PhzF family phenazine biosynthesis protein [Marivirga harenae]|tara:strand:- start:657 stop:1451 length:795 start_codon:yes stop_codon:yes gene_type:complete
MKIPIYQIDAFTDQLFGGNPAAVCPLENWLNDKVLQQIAIENNQAETAFFVKIKSGQYQLRWFTPEFEMDLCGHATLASAFVIMNHIETALDSITFETQSGTLKVQRTGKFYELDFPSRPAAPSSLPTIISDSLNIQPKEVWKARDYLLLYDSEEEIRNLKPNQQLLNQINIDPGGIIVTARADRSEVDFVSRLFVPQATIFEDPVTGSAHCTLVPFWAEKLNKTHFSAHQISEREGQLICELQNDRVLIKGKAIQYMEGVIEL